jgi:uncharacterized protein (DUF983 family)
MKPANKIPTRLDALAARINEIEARLAPWPVWKRLVVFIPVFLVSASLLVMLIYGLAYGVQALLTAGRHG